MDVNMLTNSLTDCRFCSDVSKANGEDPIGTAGTCDHWLIFELAQPWSGNLWVDNPTVQPIIALIKELIVKHGVKLKPMAIAPDREYSNPGYTRVLYYYRPDRLFAEFEKQEFIVPDALVSRLAIALLKQLVEPNELSDFQQYQQKTSHIREILTCTHGNVDVACARFGYPIYQKLRSEYAAASGGSLRVWRCSHFGGHQFAPTLIDLPEGRYWGHLKSEVLDLLVQRDGSVSQLRQFYRGWAGLTKFEQIAEREIWMQEGWDWLKYHKAGQVLAMDQGGIKKYLHKFLQLVPSKRVKFLLNKLTKDAIWAKVRLEFASPDGSVRGAYEARVEVSGEVMSALSSRDDMQLQAVKQYCVRSLVKVV